MPVKKVDNLKDKTEREAGQMWQNDLKIKNLTTREWDYAVDRSMSGVSDSSIKKEILKQRRK